MEAHASRQSPLPAGLPLTRVSHAGSKRKICSGSYATAATSRQRATMYGVSHGDAADRWQKCWSCAFYDASSALSGAYCAASGCGC